MGDSKHSVHFISSSIPLCCIAYIHWSTLSNSAGNTAYLRFQIAVLIWHCLLTYSTAPPSFIQICWNTYTHIYMLLTHWIYSFNVHLTLSSSQRRLMDLGYHVSQNTNCKQPQEFDNVFKLNDCPQCITHSYNFIFDLLLRTSGQ